MKTMTQSIFLLSMGLLLTLTAACSETPAPVPPPPTDTPALAADVHIPNLEDGQAAWNEAQCAACHGPLALGGIGPKLAGTANPFPDFLYTVRTALPPKPAFSEADLNTQEVYDIYG